MKCHLKGIKVPILEIKSGTHLPDKQLLTWSKNKIIIIIKVASLNVKENVRSIAIFKIFCH
jgi:hypothetical protein